jgi:hypothetical protein
VVAFLLDHLEVRNPWAVVSLLRLLEEVGIQVDLVVEVSFAVVVVAVVVDCHT